MEATEQDVQEEVAQEDRIDEFAISAFGVLGYKNRLPNGLVFIYKKVKSHKDRLQPSRLSPEGFAVVAAMYELLEKE